MYSVGERGVLGGPAEGAEFEVGDLFVGPGAFAFGIGGGDGRERFVEVGGEELVASALGEGGIVGDVVDLAGGIGGLDEEGEGGYDIVAVYLVEVSGGVGFVFFDGGSAFEEFLKVDGAGGAVDTGEAGNGAIPGEDQIFGFA